MNKEKTKTYFKILTLKFFLLEKNFSQMSKNSNFRHFLDYFGKNQKNEILFQNFYQRSLKSSIISRFKIEDFKDF